MARRFYSRGVDVNYDLVNAVPDVTVECLAKGRFRGILLPGDLQRLVPPKQ